MKKIILITINLIIFLVLPCLTLADGILIPVWPVPRPVPREEVPPPLTIKYHRVEINIENQVAKTKIDQVFFNDYNREIEGLYIFPIPEDASINEFAMFVDGKRIKGEMLDKEKAKEIYEEIVRKRKDPAILEYIGKNAFRARVFPIPAKGEKRIQLEYTETLKYDAGIIKYLYPLNTEKFSAKPLEEVTLSLKLKSQVPIKTCYSPSHIDKLAINKKDENTLTASFEEKNVKPDKDFIFYYGVSKENFGLNLLTYKSKNEKFGYFMLLVSPPSVKTTKIIPKDIIFVFDTSGSMSGEKIEQAKKSLKFCINNLNKEDRFNIINFNTDINTFKKDLTDYNNKSKQEALAYVSDLKAIGGTDINDALTSAISLFEDNSNPKIIVFTTDGLPTSGETEIKNILNNIKKANSKMIRIFTFGVGYDVNTHLLDNLSEKNKGVSEYIKPEEDMEIKVSSFYSKISNPVLSDLKLNFDKIEVNPASSGAWVKDLYPKNLPDLFEGSQLITIGKYISFGNSIIKITGKSQEQEIKIIHEGTFSEENPQNEFLPRLWATRRVGYLLDEIRLNGENKELIDEIKDLGKKYGIMTPYTSFLVLESEQDYKRWGIIPSMLGGGEARDKVVSKVLRTDSGFNAIQGATSIRALKDELAYNGKTKISSSKIKTIGDKTFYLKNDFWVDSEYKEDMQFKTIKYQSEEYFKLITENIKLGKYLSVGEKIVVYFESIAYRIE